jgi:hypothetical protein
MANRNVIRIAPVRDGAQIANAWRFWSQGDEFYAAARDAVNFGKISFHRNGNWQLRTGTVMQRLAPGLKLTGGWIHALELVYLVGDGVLLPKSQCEENVMKVDVPGLSKLLIDLIISGSSRQPSHIPAEMRGTTLKVLGLRSGQTLMIIGRVMPFNKQDMLAIADMRAKLKVSYATNLPAEDDAYIEASMHSFRPGQGNIIQVIPVGTETFVVDPTAHVAS